MSNSRSGMDGAVATFDLVLDLVGQESEKESLASALQRSEEPQVIQQPQANSLNKSSSYQNDLCNNHVHVLSSLHASLMASVKLWSPRKPPPPLPPLPAPTDAPRSAAATAAARTSPTRGRRPCTRRPPPCHSSAPAPMSVPRGKARNHQARVSSSDKSTVSSASDKSTRQQQPRLRKSTRQHRRARCRLSLAPPTCPFR